jgi:predicted CXXCH cytochrome family protein
MNKRTSVIISLLLVGIVLVTFTFIIYASDTDAKSGDKCAECHADSKQFKEWQNSAHANALQTIQKEPKADSRCLKCHTSDYNTYAQSTAWGAPAKPLGIKDVKNSVSCSSCHRHGSGLKHNLIMPVDKLCISCHKYDCG